MRFSIVTKALGPTNNRGARVVARAADLKEIVPYDYALSVADNHRAAAKALAQRFGWAGRWYGASCVSGSCYVFVCESSLSFDISAASNEEG